MLTEPRRLTVLVALALLLVPRIAGAQLKASGHRVSSLEIKVLSTMLADIQGFGEWGFAALVEVDGRRILFDTGANEDTVLRNLKVLNVALNDVDTVILSHHHADHTTGLLTLRRQLMTASPRALSKVYAGRGLFWPRIGTNSEVDDRMGRIRKEFEATGGTVVEVTGPTEIAARRLADRSRAALQPERNWSTLAASEATRGISRTRCPRT